MGMGGSFGDLVIGDGKCPAVTLRALRGQLIQ
jgi:hypothetical protein